MSATKLDFILMADDDEDDQLLVKDAIAEGGLAQSIRFVANGEELLDYLLRRGAFADAGQHPMPSLILLDLNMPRKDGREALREIRAHPQLRRIPVVVFTTSKADTDISALYDLGANSFVAKPTAFDALVKVLSAVTGYWFGVVQLPQARPQSP